VSSSAPVAAPAEPSRQIADVVSVGTPRKTSRPASPGEPRRLAYLYILPAFAFYAAFVVVPLLHAGWISLFVWVGVSPATWVGADNYRDVLSDARIRSAFAHSLVLIAFYSLLPVGLGLLLAASLSRMRVRGLAAFRAILFLPQVIALIVVGVIWRWIYAPGGPLNEALHAFGLDSLARVWLGDFSWALPSVGFVGTWVSYGLAMVLFIAGVQKIPPSLYDAARVDGAGPVREFFAVTLPGLRNEIVVALTLTVISALHSFDLIFITTRGGPGDATNVPALELYQRAFITGRVGSAAAIGIALAAVIFLVVFLITRLAEKRES
jgi:raffinose/stachyose/melibiose transport system permease protein